MRLSLNHLVAMVLAHTDADLGNTAQCRAVLSGFGMGAAAGDVLMPRCMELARDLRNNVPELSDDDVRVMYQIRMYFGSSDHLVHSLVDRGLVYRRLALNGLALTPRGLMALDLDERRRNAAG